MVVWGEIDISCSEKDTLRTPFVDRRGNVNESNSTSQLNKGTIQSIGKLVQLE
jgi:hypothetical protein